jgi:hypothetical protein
VAATPCNRTVAVVGLRLLLITTITTWPGTAFSIDA